MKLVSTQNIKNYDNQNVTLNGWVYNSRRSGKIAFLMLRDGFGMIQGIIEKSHIGDDKFEEFKKITQESSMSIEGKVVKNERAIGGYEILSMLFKSLMIILLHPKNMAQIF